MHKGDHTTFSHFYHMDTCKWDLAMLPLWKQWEGTHNPKTNLFNVEHFKNKNKNMHFYAYGQNWRSYPDAHFEPLW
jgi:hypothetical protein